jgi:monoamine oxidase
LVYFAGEAYDDKWATYLPGAYRTGIRAAAQVLSDTFGGAGEDLNAA